MILPVALPFVVVKNRIIEPVDSGIYLKFLIIFQMGIENKSDIRSNAISFMYNAFPIQGTKIASTTSDRIDIGKYFPFFCLKSTYSKTPIFFALKLKIGFLHTRATAPKFLLKYVLWHKSLKYFKKSCVIGE